MTGGLGRDPARREVMQPVKPPRCTTGGWPCSSASVEMAKIMRFTLLPPATPTHELQRLADVPTRGGGEATRGGGDSARKRRQSGLGNGVEPAVAGDTTEQSSSATC